VTESENDKLRKSCRIKQLSAASPSVWRHSMNAGFGIEGLTSALLRLTYLHKLLLGTSP
jgi:hypothetical protein